MKTFLMYLVLGIVALSSACTGAVKLSPEVVVFNELQFTQPTVTDKDIVSFVFEVQNIGMKEVTFAKIFFYGIPGLTIPPHLLTATSPLGPPTKAGAVGDRYRNSFSLDLLKMGIDFPQGTMQTYDLQTRLVYNYSAETNTVFRALTREAYLEEKQRGKDPKSVPIVTQSLGGPIQLSIKTEQPVIFHTENGAKNASILFLIENVGTGVPVPLFDESANESILDIRETNKVGKLNVLLNGNPVTCNDKGKPIPLFNNRAEVYCQLSIEKPLLEQEYALEASVAYYYIVDKKTSLNIEGTRAS